jgi:LasA protease
MLRRLALRLASLLAVTGLAGCFRNSAYIVLVTATPDPSAYSPSNPYEQPSAPHQTLAPDFGPSPTFVPTPDPTREGALMPDEQDLYTVQLGDTLNQIAQRYNVTVDSIVQANQLADRNALSVGQVLVIPLGAQYIGPAFKIIPDSELVYGPGLWGFSVADFAQGCNCFLQTYTEDVDGITMTGAEIVERVALETSISPRLLLAALEYEGGWISNAAVTETQLRYPMNFTQRPSVVFGLYKQLSWAANVLNAGYYGWRQRGLAIALLADGTRVAFAPTLNAGTVGVQHWLSQTHGWQAWYAASDYGGFFSTYARLFGDPFQYAIEPLIPPDLTQPELAFPWARGETWYFTGGPHGGWNSGSAWAALDFVSGEEQVGCDIADEWVRASADGVIARSERGIVVLDLDGDGFLGTGWTLFYLHLTSQDRPVVEGQRVRVGDPLGHPSCEGGVSYATHVHFARRYNGEWIAADCTNCPLTVPAPQMVLDGWAVVGLENEYDGALIKGDEYREACQCREPINTLTIPVEE